jgi:hypothetical protein
MIDVVEALELFEMCADEMANEEPSVGRRRLSLTARAMAKRHRANEPAMTLGAKIVFRTAHRFGRAGASTERTLDAVYHAVHRYVEIIPASLLDANDQGAVGALLAERGAPWSRPGAGTRAFDGREPTSKSESLAIRTPIHPRTGAS